MNKNKFYSWLILGTLIWLTIGIMIYPHWWFLFFYEGGFWSINFWIEGIQSIVRFLFYYNPTLLVAGLGVYFLAKKNLVDLKLPELDFFSSISKTLIPVLLSIFLGLLIWFFPFKNEFKASTNYDYLLTSKDPKQDKITSPIDFIYINKDRVDNLFEQIKPELILKEKQLENQSEEDKEISNGDNPIINAKRLEKNQSRQTETYSATEISEPKKVTSLLNHFYSLNAVKEYQTLELSAEDVKKLETFRTISQQFQITFDKPKFVQVYNRVIGESLIKEHATMKNLSGQVVIKGDFLISNMSEKTILKHNYIQIDENNRITFNVATISKTEKTSATLSDAGQNNKTMNLNVFGKITRVESNNKITDIYFDAYAIW